MAATDPAPAATRGRERWLLIACLALVVWAHQRVFAAFFSSDDLVHLQQAVGLRPTLATPFRFLSQVLYFRAMVPLFGLLPLPYHLVTMGIHLLNVVLVFRYARRCGVDPATAALGAAAFGCFPLFHASLSSAVGVNDGLALALTLVALLLLQRPGGAPAVAAAPLFALALLSKESVIALPALGLIGRPPGIGVRRQAQRLAPVAAVGAVFAASFALLRPPAPAPGANPYGVALGPHLFHNAMTYLSWSVDLWHPLPDLVSSHDPAAWRVGLVVLAVLVLAGWTALRRRDPAITLGATWWLAGIAPVLLLVTQTYAHYMYAAQPGLALAAAGVAIAAVAAACRAGRVSPMVAGRVTAAFAALVAVLYALQARALVDGRLAARVPGVTLALDPDVRRREVAENAMRSLQPTLGPEPVRLAILMYGPRAILGTRTGVRHEEVSPRVPSVLEAATDHGGAIRLFFPQVDSVAFVQQWSRGYDDFVMFLNFDRGRLELVGRGPGAHLLLARWLLDQKEYGTAIEHLGPVLERYPDDPDLRMAYAAALAWLGEDTDSRRQLHEVIRVAPASSAAASAASLLNRSQR